MDLTNAMMIHIDDIVNGESRPFSYLDFLNFELDGQTFTMTHGTFRNKISQLMKEGIMEVAYKSHLTFYTLKGITFGNRHPMTRNHPGVTSHPNQQLSNNPLYRIIKDLPLNKNAVHDIRLRFHVANIYHLISSNNGDNEIDDPYINAVSKDICLPVWNIENLDIKGVIHNTDTVSITVGCSYNPVPIDVDGVIRLSSALAVARDRLSTLVSEASGESNNTNKIAHHLEWIVTIWHFGADASVEYSGDRFSATWGVAQNAIIRIYSKTMKDHKTRIRLERQEYPRTTLALALEQKINHNYNRWSGGE